VTGGLPPLPGSNIIGMGGEPMNGHPAIDHIDDPTMPGDDPATDSVNGNNVTRPLPQGTDAPANTLESQANTSSGTRSSPGISVRGYA
jgi:hypothetical protein